MLRRFSVDFAILSIALDALFVVLSLAISGLLRPYLSNLPFALPFLTAVEWPPASYVVFPLVWVGVLSLFTLYDGRKHPRFITEVWNLTLASMLVAVALAGLLYLSYRETSRVMFLSFVALAYLGLLGWRAGARAVFSINRGKRGNRHRVLIAGAGPLGRGLQAQVLKASAGRLVVAGLLDDDPAKTEANPDVLGSIDQARRLIVELEITDLIIALPLRAHERIQGLVKDLIDVPVRVWVVPDFFHISLHHAQAEDFAGIPMLDLRAPALSEYQRFVKRIFDLALSGLFLLIGLPLMGIIALAILVDDGRPILFRQRRVGENGHIFEIYKFRTMVRNAEQLKHLVERTDEDGNIIHKVRNDPRVTRAGRFLRRFSLDELPQLFNVFVGKMSLVGPRPELPYLVDQYEPWQRKRFAVPQGLTGWWQIHGRSDKPMHLNTEEDLYYIQNYSMWLDLKILLQTFWWILGGKGAF
jgi:exopolysaccharide biosynthesis polyprenyl glycosylphosphotransferase